MTAIITKSNARNGAFVMKGSGQFDSLTVNGELTVKGTNILDAINDHEGRIKVLEENPVKPDGETSLQYEDGLDEFIIDKNSLSQTQSGDYYELEIKGDFTGYTGDLFEVILPSYISRETAIISCNKGTFLSLIHISEPTRP